MNASAIEALYATGYWLLERHRVSDAAEMFRAMALAAPTDERSWLALGRCHEQNGQLGIASELYRIATEAAAPAVRCTIARGRVLRTLGLTDLADDAFVAAHEAAVEIGDHVLAALAAEERSAS